MNKRTVVRSELEKLIDNLSTDVPGRFRAQRALVADSGSVVHWDPPQPPQRRRRTTAR
jgi:hypothetical protein